jgi:hypothetical protein
MKTELEQYIKFIDSFDKSHKYVVEVKNVDCSKNDSNNSISFCEVMDLQDIGIIGITPYLYTHFSFTPKNLDDEGIKDIEVGVANLRENGYRIAYRNNAVK